ncbi:MAG: type IV secretion system protein, partial [Alphaproteobacteria bacterium]|nr:type IV secretion system protein [Alphaproteobacteria bacterium]
MMATLTALFRRLQTVQGAVVLLAIFVLATIAPAYAQSEIDVGLSTADIRVEGCEVVYETQCVITPIAWDEEKGVDGRAIASIFSYTVCNVEQILGEVFGEMWCAVSEAAMGPVAAVLVLYVAITGLMLTLGMIELTGAEIAKHVVKIGLVWVFVTNPDYALGIVYRFYMFVLKDGIDIVFTGTNPAGVNSTTDVMHHLDIAAEKIFGGPEDEGITFMAAVSALLFTPGGNITGPMLAAEALFSFFVFARTVMAYLISIAGMVFLLTLGPIFIPMALFSKTSDIFERWVKHITSFALQPIII